MGQYGKDRDDAFTMDSGVKLSGILGVIYFALAITHDHVSVSYK